MVNAVGKGMARERLLKSNQLEQDLGKPYVIVRVGRDWSENMATIDRDPNYDPRLSRLWPARVVGELVERKHRRSKHVNSLFVGGPPNRQWRMTLGGRHTSVRQAISRHKTVNSAFDATVVAVMVLQQLRLQQFDAFYQEQQ